MPDNRDLGSRSGSGVPDTAPLPARCSSPVFVLSASRSGSTLVRFLLDSHPDLACPPESNVTATCFRLMHSWDILETAGAGGHTAGAGGRTAAETAEEADWPGAPAAVRDTIDAVYGRYLQRRGKRRWCDKSLGSHQYAELALLLYPEAQFICLYRHAMDVIASGVSACPWGLHRFGFDSFAAEHAGNSVAAIASYWLATVQSIMAFENAYPDKCHRLRYEDLVRGPEEAAAAMLSFLGAEPAPGISEACFRTPHEDNGPGDEEIWFTDGITAESVGSGVRVPSAALTPQLRQDMNAVLARLDYRTVEDEWNAWVGRADVCADSAGERPFVSDGRPPGQQESQEVVRAIENMLRSVPARELHTVSTIWPAAAGQTVALVAEDAQGAHAGLRWRLADRRDDPGAQGQPSDEPVCTIIAGHATWRALLAGEANVVTEMTAGRLRCLNRRDGHRIRSDELHAISWLLGFAQVPLLRVPGP